jgi:hypothetical protein
METHKAFVTDDGSEHTLNLQAEDFVLKIPLTKDEPNDIKKAFNELIIHLRKGLFEFSMADEEHGDLIFQVAKEYVQQLNKDLKEVYRELESHQLTEKSTAISSSTDEV